MTRTSITWGVPVPWDAGHVFYVWYDALINYAPPSATAPTRRASTAWWPAVHHLIGKDILRFHCVYWPAMLMAAGERPAGPRPRARLPARRRREDEQDGAQPDRPGRSHPRLRRRRLPLPLPPRSAVRARRRLLLRGDGRPVQRRPGQQPRQPGWPGWPRSSAQVRRASARARRPTRPWPRWRHRSWPPPPMPGSGSRRREALDATWRLIRETNAAPRGQRAVEGRARARRSTPCSATPSRSSASSPSWRRRRWCAPASSCGDVWVWPGLPTDVRVPDGLAWGGYPGGLPVEKGTSLFPRLPVPREGTSGPPVRSTRS